MKNNCINCTDCICNLNTNLDSWFIPNEIKYKLFCKKYQKVIATNVTCLKSIEKPNFCK